MKNISLWGMMLVSLGNPQEWSELKFSKIPANLVDYSAENLKIEVKNSASPLIFKFAQLEKVKKLNVDFEVIGEMNIPADGKWDNFEEDSFLRVGVVAEGQKKLSGVSSWFAPAWVKKMFSLAPKGTGLDKIYFYNVVSQQSLLGKKRQHPLSKYMMEENVAVRTKGNNVVKISKTFDPPLSAAGLWLSSDGDDSKSSFTVRIKKIEIDR